MHKTFGQKENIPYHDRKGAYLIPIQGNQVAVVQTPKGYFLIGGGLENGETDRQCIERECMEETGYAAAVGKCVCSAEKYALHPELGGFHPIQTYYLGDLRCRENTPTDTDHRLVWVAYEEIKDQMYSDMQGWAITQCWKARREPITTDRFTEANTGL
jgi:8-oxo-dGTP diphosphatase